MFPLSLLVCLVGAIDLGSWDFQPWDNVVSVNDPAGSPLVAKHRLRGIIQWESSAGVLPDRDTLQYWTDSRGVCRSVRQWRYADTTSLETSDFFGVNAGRNALPPDSGRTSRIVGGQLREVGTLRSQHSGQRTVWTFRKAPAPEEFWYDWDSTIVDRDALGRITSKREIWTNFAWYSDSVTWAADGSPSQWITRSGGGWTDLMEVHTPQWSDGRLIQDDVLTVTEGATTTPDTTFWRLSCSWIEDSLLRGCTTRIKSTNTTLRTYRRPFDSLVVHRTEGRRPYRLDTHLDGLFIGLTLWDDQGRKVTQRSLDSIGNFRSLSVDSTQYGDLPWPIKTSYGYGSASTLFDDIPLDEISTLRWDLDPEVLGVSRRKPSSTVRVFNANGQLQVETHATVSGTVLILDPAGRERARTILREGRATVSLPEQGGVWLWRLTDRDGQAMDQGRIAIP